MKQNTVDREVPLTVDPPLLSKALSLGYFLAKGATK